MVVGLRRGNGEDRVKGGTECGVCGRRREGERTEGGRGRWSEKGKRKGKVDFEAAQTSLVALRLASS